MSDLLIRHNYRLKIQLFSGFIVCEYYFRKCKSFNFVDSHKNPPINYVCIHNYSTSKGNNVYMQYKSHKTLQINKEFGQVIGALRVKKNPEKSRLQFCYEYDLDAGNLSRIENGLIDPKLSMLWRLSEAIDIPLSEIFKVLEERLGKDFFVIDR